MIKPEPKHIFRETVLARYWPAALIGVAWIWIFWPMMSGRTVVGFRDSAYLYYPLFKWIDAQWAAGEIPLWNAWCNFGMPVVGDGTSSVFYPGKIIFFCRFLSYPARYGIYLAIHIPIAAYGTYALARTLRSNRAGATLAAFSFAFGGSVLFQVTNVIYLVSAAWLPLALYCVWKMVKTRQARWAIGAGICCALMILGGDPQMVYHVGLIASATIAGEFLRKRQRWKRTKNQTNGIEFPVSSPATWLTGAGFNLALMIAVTSTLAAVQILPTWNWSKNSERTNPDAPANIYMAMSHVFSEGKPLTEVANSLLGPPMGVADHGYQFSQPPWSMAELMWPNISGKPFPRNQRWTSSLPGAERVWVPSLYVGVIVVFLAAIGIRLWGRRRRQVWLTRLLLFSGLASFGWYGTIWLISEILPASGLADRLGPQVGGIYWAMNVLLPKYFAFRYPAKLFLIASLALSLLAGINLRSIRFSAKFGKTFNVIGIAYLILTGCGLVVFTFVFRTMLSSTMPTDFLFGPFDSDGAIQGIYVSLVQPIVVVACGILLVTVATRKQNRLVPISAVPMLFVILTVLDVLFANRWLVPDVDVAAFESETEIHQHIVELVNLRQTNTESPHQAVRIYRSRIAMLEPDSWQSEISDRRLSEIVSWYRESLYPKQHLGEDIVLVGSFSSVWPMVHEQLLSYLDQLPPDSPQIQSLVDASIQKTPNGKTELVVYPNPPMSLEPVDNVFVLTHQPMPFWIGAWISGLSWCFLLVGFSLHRYRSSS